MTRQMFLHSRCIPPTDGNPLTALDRNHRQTPRITQRLNANFIYGVDLFRPLVRHEAGEETVISTLNEDCTKLNEGSQDSSQHSEPKPVVRRNPLTSQPVQLPMCFNYKGLTCCNHS
ncbi:hypothetical protein Zmor_028531 [Zophobas morio]|jgi:hypothetical protein|uniref:Uncharacterized protein n=1 Tax=Zophobas morio TaxID=2755281 RepID=A0AA38M129_9CUCU|nr:hypothetical protein Zmor_028531 [Zophobas morio]